MLFNEGQDLDLDTDGDGVLDRDDRFPADPLEWDDSDNDGVGDNGDVFPEDASETRDSDGDGVGDNADVFPEDPRESADTDGDGVGDNIDVFPEDASESVDTDGDGVGDNEDAFPHDAAAGFDTGEGTTQEQARRVARLYTAAFNRAPDLGGLSYWIDRWETEFSVDEIAARFYDSDEFRQTYGEPDNSEYVAILYRNILHREGDAGGIAYWIARLEQGTPRARVLAEFSDSIENRTNTLDLFRFIQPTANGRWTF
jgi:hypothetical protein